MAEKTAEKDKKNSAPEPVIEQKKIRVINGNSYPVNIGYKGKTKVLSPREDIEGFESEITFTSKTGLRII